MTGPRDDGQDELSWHEAETLRDFAGRAAASPLTEEERRLVLDQAVAVLDGFYVHLPQKGAAHGANPVQRLKEVRRNLSHLPSDQDFFGELCDAFVVLRDLHTAFVLPTLYQEHAAVLPFQVEAYRDDGVEGGCRYVVTRVLPGFVPGTAQNSAPFVPGVEVVEWSGVPIRRAVQVAALRSAGTSPEARHGRGVAFLTARPMQRQPPPDEAWVEVLYRAEDGRTGTLRCDWRVIPVQALSAGPGPEAPGSPAAAGKQGQRQGQKQGRTQNPRQDRGMDLGIDPEAYALGRARVRVHVPQVIAAERRAAQGRPRAASIAGGKEKEIETPLPGKVTARRVRGGRFGYVRIHSFATDDPDGYLDAFAGLLAALPRQGMVLDVRGNGGGRISLAERMLQLLTWRPVQPAPAQLIATPEVLELCRAVDDLGPWTESVQYALDTGARYSDPRPMTPVADCNEVGQRYHGPVVLVVDALCYSATDIFAAGFQDHRIGRVLGCDGTTGAGGANVLLHADLRDRMAEGGDGGAVLRRLPHGSGLRFAIRRTLRVGDRAGAVLEEAGVRPDILPLHRITRADLLDGNRDLIARAAEELADLPWYVLDAHRAAGGLRVATRGIGRVDAYLDGRPLGSYPAVAGAREEAELHVPVPDEPWSLLELKGFADGEQVAARRLRA